MSAEGASRLETKMDHLSPAVSYLSRYKSPHTVSSSDYHHGILELTMNLAITFSLCIREIQGLEL